MSPHFQTLESRKLFSVPIIAAPTPAPRPQQISVDVRVGDTTTPVVPLHRAIDLNQRLGCINLPAAKQG